MCGYKYRHFKVPFLFFVLSLVVHISGGLRLQTAAHVRMISSAWWRIFIDKTQFVLMIYWSIDIN